ncbi:hypothetical protein ACFY0R_09895 [Streptomyces sp. NPDC001633]|uniref:MmyB family transcriptional regulator n=1 Tax=Streptomyces sp. NPDC001633 TaxID=3364595 RepID=UPI0036C730D6
MSAVPPGDEVPRGEGVPEMADVESRPGQLMGLAGLLRAWRAAASQRLGRQITQKEIGIGAGRSERWYRLLESGANVRLERQHCEFIGEKLLLGRDELQALIFYSIGGAISAGVAPGFESPTRRALQDLLDQQMPNPTWLLDARWNVIGYNEAMKSWCPWVMESGANLLRWGLLSEEARKTFVDWPKHAVEYLAMLRFSMLRYPQDPELGALLADITKDPYLANLWETRSEVTEARENFYYRVSLPEHDFKVVELESQTLFPASLPECRIVIMHWLPGDESEGTAGPAARPVVAEARSQHSAQPLPGQVTAPTAAQAAAYAGDGAVPLPIFSELHGAGCQLTYAPSTRTVIWATPQEDGRWDVAEVSPYTVIVRAPQVIYVEGASEEYKLLARAVLPRDPAGAIQRIQSMTAHLRRRIELLEEVHGELWEANPQSFPIPGARSTKTHRPAWGANVSSADAAARATDWDVALGFSSHDQMGHMAGSVQSVDIDIAEIAQEFHFVHPSESDFQRAPVILRPLDEDASAEQREAATAEVLDVIVERIGPPTLYGGGAAGPVIRWRDEHRTVLLDRSPRGLQLSVRRTAELEAKEKAEFANGTPEDPATYFSRLPYLWQLQSGIDVSTPLAVPAVPLAPDWQCLEESLKALLRAWWEQLPTQIGHDTAGFNIVPCRGSAGTFSTLSVLCSKDDGVLLLVDDREVPSGTSSAVMAGRGWHDRIMGWWQRDFYDLGSEGPAAAARMAVEEMRVRGVASPSDLGIADVRCEDGGLLTLSGFALRPCDSVNGSAGAHRT